MRTRLLVVFTAAIAVIAVVGGAGYIYYFSGLRSAPAQLGLSATPTATTTSPVTTPTAAASLTGSWTVATGSVAGYRIKELFVGQASKHEAVARTSTITGGLTVRADSSGYVVSSLTFTADLTSLHSVDSVAGRDVTQRDGVVSRQLDVQQFSTATFTTTSATVPGAISSSIVDLTVTGKLTIHGVTRDVTVKAKAQIAGSKAEIAGSTSIAMTDYGVSPPFAPFVTVDPTLLIEFDIFLTPST
ncbi:MAG TPA: YceI family protein [Candidatus Dormibacteraeota bacterium]|jgi:polyisoprenoid-binding protein YceI|nr:YceI family protein [Candidatus Dormibacteraeota bacterium]